MSDSKSNCLFIVGMARSGTKLFRDLCNQHSQINIPEVETHFFPLLIDKFGLNFEKEEISHAALLKFIRSTTFYYNFQQEGFEIELSDLTENVDIKSWSSILKFLLIHFSPADKKDFLYFGDKTPNYIFHLKLLKSIFPDAKIAVLIRDPRDYALSNKKTWNKSLYRAASLWRTGMAKMVSDIEDFKNDVHYVRYEDLLSDTEAVLKSFCEFLNISFEPGMVKLRKATEKVGLTKGKQYIVKDNFNKYKKDLSKYQQTKIEHVCFDLLERWYEPEYAKSLKKLSKTSLNFLRLRDGFYLWRHHMKEQKSMVKGTWYFFSLHKEKEKQRSV